MSLYERHFSNPRRERAFLSAAGFTTAFATARAITHSIRAGIGPFHNLSADGRHIHHSTFGILGLLGCGYVWTYQWGAGIPPGRRWASRLSATSYGVAAALTLDEFAASGRPLAVPARLIGRPPRHPAGSISRTTIGTSRVASRSMRSRCSGGC